MSKNKWGYKEWFYIILTIAILLVLALGSLGNDNAKLRTTKDIQQENTTKLQEQLKQLQQENKQLKISKKEATKKVLQSRRQQVVASKVKGCEQYRAEVSKYAWPVDIVLRIMKAESGCNPNAVSSTNDHGLMQLHGIRIYDPAKNIAYAYYNKYLRGGWRHWQVCVKGIVACWL